MDEEFANPELAWAGISSLILNSEKSVFLNLITQIK
jgi:hypothetical protein